MKPLLFALSLLLAACGIAGPPVPPSQVDPDDRPAARTEILVSGRAEAGVTGRF